MRPALVMLAVLSTGTACRSTPEAAPAPAPTLDQLRSMTVTGIVEDTVRLVNGRWDGPPAAPGRAMADMVMLLDQVAVGEVDGRPGDEAVAAVVHNGGGTGSFLYLVVFGTGADGLPVQRGIGLVGDRIEVRGLSVQYGDIHLDVLEAGPADPMCCPTQLARKSYDLRNGRVDLVASEVTGTLPDSTQ